MKKLFLAIAAGCAAAAAAYDDNAGAPATGDTAAGDQPKRGRPRNPAPPADEKPEPDASITDADMRALIEPLVEASRQPEVKAVTAKHGGATIATVPAANRAAWKKDIEALIL